MATAYTERIALAVPAASVGAAVGDFSSFTGELGDNRSEALSIRIRRGGASSDTHLGASLQVTPEQLQLAQEFADRHSARFAHTETGIGTPEFERLTGYREWLATWNASIFVPSLSKNK